MIEYIFEVKHDNRVEDVKILTEDSLTRAYEQVISRFRNIRSIKLESQINIDEVVFEHSN